MLRLFFILVVFLFSKCAQASHTIVQIYEKSAIGDKNQIIGVVNKLKRDHPEWDVIDCPCDKETNVEQLTAKVLSVPVDKKRIVIGIGKTAFLVFGVLPSDVQIQTLAMGHQWTDAYTNLLGKVTWIAVPSYAIPDTLINDSVTKIIRTNGVSHAMSHESLQAEYGSYEDQFSLIKASDRVVILGGDAPGADAIQKRFTEEDASALADAVFRESPHAIFYVVDGPRTGKFDENLIEIEGVHKNGPRNAVTSAFLETLTRNIKKQGVSSDRIKMYDFRYGEKSLYVPLIAAALLHSATVWVPGESSSMICEVISNIAPSNVIIYDNNAMNSAHLNHVDSVCMQGRARHYTSLGELINAMPLTKIASFADANVQIAKIIIE